ncbi:hypothetical protein HII17_15435 [Thalassotalea sp. M1531]|uniref:Uncharacterized protein n=1 Tax=Thalassotalea algicola TaxID=2716224 RepID=A0A7Y0LGT0_9GAMM|nr:hypothetical protein [Thalassotalea algicola]NMP32950.1 hypothetical protein [Thalassotalea algicola]
MEELKKHPFAVGLIVILVAIKFVILPILNWQNKLIDEIRLNEKRLVKTQALIQNGDLLQKNYADLLAEESKLYSLYHVTDDLGNLQRILQRDIEDRLKNLGLKISSIGWKTPIKLDKASVSLIYIDYRIEGSSKNVINHILKLSLMAKPPKIEALNLVFQRSEVGKIKRLNARISLSFAVRSESQKVQSQQGVYSVSD